MPRKSLPATVSTPKASATVVRPQSTVKRRKLSHADTDETPLGPSGRPMRRAAAAATAEAAPVKAQNGTQEPEDPETELEAWQDFAAEHYEMIEQLPLELHRNFRLLRELDDGCLGQQIKLESLIREYVAARMKLAGSTTAPKRERTETSIEPVIDETKDAKAAEDRGSEAVETLEAPGHQAQPDGQAQDNDEAMDVEPPVYQNEHILAAEAEGVPVSDGRGGLALPLERGEDETPQPSAEHHVPVPFPPLPIAAVEPTPPADGDATPANFAAGTPIPHPPISIASHEDHASASAPRVLLPSIARLAREILRTGEEKVAVALGAYNAIDRHIRALDSALEAHESAIILGMRPDTHPSTAVGALQGGVEMRLEPDDGAIGLEGGPRRANKKKKGRKGQERKETVEPKGEVALGIEFDPQVLPVGRRVRLTQCSNEPRYCYCQQVSYGEMIACENGECPLEWFHLACAGFEVSPPGKWWCNICRPKVGLGMGGGAGVQPKAANHSQKKSKKTR